MRLDTYPDQVLKGEVGSIGAGTGSEFALLPAQNASGNWVKVVQRVPLRVQARRTARRCRRSAPGMSASVEVDTGHARGLPKVVARRAGGARARRRPRGREPGGRREMSAAASAAGAARLRSPTRA